VTQNPPYLFTLSTTQRIELYDDGTLVGFGYKSDGSLMPESLKISFPRILREAAGEVSHINPLGISRVVSRNFEDFVREDGIRFQRYTVRWVLDNGANFSVTYQMADKPYTSSFYALPRFNQTRGYLGEMVNVTLADPVMNLTSEADSVKYSFEYVVLTSPERVAVPLILLCSIGWRTGNGRTFPVL
jgi:hypothetical protein